MSLLSRPTDTKLRNPSVTLSTGTPVILATCCSLYLAIPLPVAVSIQLDAAKPRALRKYSSIVPVAGSISALKEPRPLAQSSK